MTAMLRTEFDAFLFAPIAEGANGMPLTVLSLLARAGVDPWDEAADLARLPKESATEKLTSLLATVPNGPAAGVDTETLTTYLIALLHLPPAPKPPAPKASAPEVPPRVKVAKVTKDANLAIYYLAGLILMLFAQWAMSTGPTQAPMDTSITPDPRR